MANLVRFIEVEDLPLPASAQASIYTVAMDYLHWLTLFDRNLSDLVQIDWINFRKRTDKHIPPYESLALSMWTAPYWSRFVEETSWVAYNTVMAVK